MADRRCYVCNALPQDGCQAIGGEVAECPRPSTPRPAKLRKCVGGRTEHQMEPEWEGRSYAFMRCRWCGKREAV